MMGTVFLPEVRAVSGAKSLPRNILAANDGRDLDKVLASAGTIQVLPKEPLRPFNVARKGVDSLLLSRGTRFFGGFLVDESIADEIRAKLDSVKVEFEKAKTCLINNIGQYVEDRVKEAPEWEDIIRSNAPRREDLMEDISFSYVSAPIDLNDPLVESALNGSPLAIRIAKEMATTCRAWLAESHGSKKGLPGLAVLKAVAKKAAALTFVDGRFKGLVDALGRIIAQSESAIGTDGQGAASMVVSGVIRTMSDPREVIEIADRGECQVRSMPLPIQQVVDEPDEVEDDEAVETTAPSWAF